MNLLSMTCDQLAEEMRRRYGRGHFHAAALYKAFYRRADLDVSALPEFAASPELAARVRQDLEASLPSIVAQVRDQGACKLALRLADGLEIETVVIPMPEHTTVCVSSQAGCRMGCRFCTTGQMGLRRHLRAHEIVAQVFTVAVRLGMPVRNVVFMGMGEPLDNLIEVAQAIRVLEDQRGLDIAKSHVTLSTVGLPEGIAALGRLGWPRLKLAVSLNAPDDAVRSRLMPINDRYPLQALKSALRAYPLARGSALFIEYVLIKGINDHPEHARLVAHYLHGLPVKINLIPYNPRPGGPFEPPAAPEVDRFRQALVARNLFVRLRTSRGEAIQAACGQLGARRTPTHVTDTGPV